MLHAASFLPGVSVQDLPGEQHSWLSPREDTKQHSRTEGKEASAAKGHRALLSRKQTLHMTFLRDLFGRWGGWEHTLQRCKCRDKFPQTNVCHIIHRHLLCPKSIIVSILSWKAEVRRCALKSSHCQMWSGDHVATSLCFSSFVSFV